MEGSRRERKKISKPLKKKYGHTPLSAGEVEPLLRENLEVIMVGTGQYGDLPITPDAKEMLDSREAVVKTTQELLPMLERALSEEKDLVAIIHLTC
jgi:hypothetical protein